MNKFCKVEDTVKGFRWEGNNLNDLARLYYPQQIPLSRVVGKRLHFLNAGKEEDVPVGSWITRDSDGRTMVHDWISFKTNYRCAVDVI